MIHEFMVIGIKSMIEESGVPVTVFIQCEVVYQCHNSDPRLSSSRDNDQ